MARRTRCGSSYSVRLTGCNRESRWRLTGCLFGWSHSCYSCKSSPPLLSSNLIKIHADMSSIWQACSESNRNVCEQDCRQPPIANRQPLERLKPNKGGPRGRPPRSWTDLLSGDHLSCCDQWDHLLSSQTAGRRNFIKPWRIALQQVKKSLYPIFPAIMGFSLAELRFVMPWNAPKAKRNEGWS